MSNERRARVLAELAKQGDLDGSRLCDVAGAVVGVTGAGIMIMSSDSPLGSLCSSNAMSGVIEDLQYALGEGPCVDAYGLDRPVLEPDLANPATPRWLAFSRGALEVGARAVFGFPLRFGAARLGALNLCSDRAGALSDDQYADALTVADVAAEAVLVLQAGAPPGQLATALETDANFQYVVHQAAGMVSVHLSVSIAEALVRLRAHAFATGRPLTDVAADVVALKLRLAHD
ncbi:MAG TPA: GAF and ANTAR domain-containing protein [Acidimicrobiales bacterium]|nr:GAF and ANTAR domain-containing protein [Acidimicrobiales bacterium]